MVRPNLFPLRYAQRNNDVKCVKCQVRNTLLVLHSHQLGSAICTCLKPLKNRSKNKMEQKS